MITEEQLRAEWDRLGQRIDKGMTFDELMERWNASRYEVDKRLRAADKLGLLRVGRKTIRTRTGRPLPVCSYWLEEPKKKR